jgi:uncharacterized protein YqjF (DUF2071 family)
MIMELLEAPARQASVAADTAHRPWPPPAEPWVLAQTWADLLFAHWRVPVESVRALVPAELDVVRVGSRRRSEGRYRATGQPVAAEHGSLEWFLAERYCLYALDAGRLARAEVQHPPWPLQAAGLELEDNTNGTGSALARGQTLVPFLTPSGRRDLAASTGVSAVGTPQDARQFDIYSGWQPKARRGE